MVYHREMINLAFEKDHNFFPFFCDVIDELPYLVALIVNNIEIIIINGMISPNCSQSLTTIVYRLDISSLIRAA